MLKNKELIKKLRRGLGSLTAEACGITPNYMSKLAHEKRHNPAIIKKATEFNEEIDRVVEDFKNRK